MADVSTIDQKDAYKYEYNILSYLGINVITSKRPFPYYVRFLIVLALVITFISSIASYIVVETKIDKIIGAFYFFMTELTFFCKLLNYLYNRQKIAKIDQLYSKRIFNCYSQKQHPFIAEAVFSANLLSKVYRILIILCLILYTSIPFIDNRLPLDARFPFSIEKYKYFLIVYQILGIAISSLINSSMDNMTIGFISVATAHFSIIKDILVSIKAGENPDDVKKKISHCSYYHTNVIHITTQIEDVFSYGILMQFATSVTVLCITGFEMLIVPKQSAEFGMLMIYLLLIMCQVSLYCWFGHDLMLKSEEVRDACYMSEWTDYDPSIRRMLFIIMERSKRPVRLTAGKFVFLSIPTLVSIFRSAYSYYAILRQVFSKNAK